MLLVFLVVALAVFVGVLVLRLGSRRQREWFLLLDFVFFVFIVVMLLDLRRA